MKLETMNAFEKGLLSSQDYQRWQKNIPELVHTVGRGDKGDSKAVKKKFQLLLLFLCVLSYFYKFPIEKLELRVANQVLLTINSEEMRLLFLISS